MNLIVDFPKTRASSRHKQRVTFQDEVDMQFIKNLAFSKHREDIWFSKEEMYSFQYQAALRARSIASSGMTMAEYAELPNQETSAFLGLESYFTEKTFREIKRCRAENLVAVLAEQRRQYRFGINDPDALARASQDASDRSATRARMIGMIHAKKEE